MVGASNASTIHVTDEVVMHQLPEHAADNPNHQYNHQDNPAYIETEIDRISWLIRDLLMINSRCINDKFMINQWSIHGSVMINSWLITDQFMINYGSIHGYFLINSRYVSDQFMVNLWSI